MSAIFIAGTDTDIGKTVVTGLLGKYLKDKGYSVITQKWIQSGSKDYPVDIKTHLDIMGMKKKEIENWLSDVCPYNFSFPASPHLAAELENKRIEIKKIKNSFYKLNKKFDFVIVEGTGGILVPINSKKLIIDVVEELNLPVILVAGNKLGAINHTLLTTEVLDKKRLNTLGIIFNNCKYEQNNKILNNNVNIVAKFSGKKIFGTLQYLKDIKNEDNFFNDIGNNIYEKIK